jgi:pyruvate/2-oxoglutarate dehydrogenase complex dihydrolipoamide dehydrogenase (E3) component
MVLNPPIPPRDEHSRKLTDNVHPPAWQNPEPAPRYNLVVIGAGTAGLVTAAGAAGLGARVALIERSLMGGDCLNTGCVPSKGVIRASRAAYDVKIADEFGVRAGDVSVNFGKAMERMRRIRAEISLADSAVRFSRDLGVDVFFGQATFTGPDSIDVDNKQLHFRKAAICTGARAAVPALPGIEEAGYHTNETVFTMTSLPRRLAVIGGGPVGCELAQSFARLGSKVTILHRGRRLLPKDDRDASEVILQAFLRDGILVRLGTGIERVTKKEGGEKAVIVQERRDSGELVFDEIVFGTGRAPNVEGLDLERAGIEYDLREGIAVNDRLQTTNPRVYAAGDVCSPYKFTHAADAMARIVIANALFSARQKTSLLVVPWCTYTDPEVAHVGMHEDEAAERGVSVHTLTVNLRDVDRARLDGETEGFARVHLKKGSDTILGATIVARHAGDMINEISLAMTAGLGLSAIGRTIHPYPTQAEAIKKLADAHNRTRLTPLVKKLFTAWLAWRRS